MSLLTEVSKMPGGLIRSLHSKSNVLNSNSGFTLVEMIVAIGLFSLVISVAVGGFVVALRTQRQIASLIAADNNMSLALEQMAREIRTGYNFCRTVGSPCFVSPSGSCGTPSSGIASELEFINANSEFINYRYVNGAIERIGPNGSWLITGAGVIVRYLNFTIRGTASQDCWPPMITISAGVSPNDPALQDTVINLQTTVSARQIDS